MTETRRQKAKREEAAATQGQGQSNSPSTNSIVSTTATSGNDPIRIQVLDPTQIPIPVDETNPAGLKIPTPPQTNVHTPRTQTPGLTGHSNECEDTAPTASSTTQQCRDKGKNKSEVSHAAPVTRPPRGRPSTSRSNLSPQIEPQEGTITLYVGNASSSKSYSKKRKITLQEDHISTTAGRDAEGNNRSYNSNNDEQSQQTQHQPRPQHLQNGGSSSAKKPRSDPSTLAPTARTHGYRDIAPFPSNVVDPRTSGDYKLPQRDRDHLKGLGPSSSSSSSSNSEDENIASRPLKGIDAAEALIEYHNEERIFEDRKSYGTAFGGEPTLQQNYDHGQEPRNSSATEDPSFHELESHCGSSVVTYSNPSVVSSQLARSSLRFPYPGNCFWDRGEEIFRAHIPHEAFHENINHLAHVYDWGFQRGVATRGFPSVIYTEFIPDPNILTVDHGQNQRRYPRTGHLRLDERIVDLVVAMHQALYDRGYRDGQRSVRPNGPSGSIANPSPPPPPPHRPHPHPDRRHYTPNIYQQPPHPHAYGRQSPKPMYDNRYHSQQSHQNYPHSNEYPQEISSRQYPSHSPEGPRRSYYLPQQQQQELPSMDLPPYNHRQPTPYPYYVAAPSHQSQQQQPRSDDGMYTYRGSSSPEPIYQRSMQRDRPIQSATLPAANVGPYPGERARDVIQSDPTRTMPPLTVVTQNVHVGVDGTNASGGYQRLDYNTDSPCHRYYGRPQHQQQDQGRWQQQILSPMGSEYTAELDAATEDEENDYLPHAREETPWPQSDNVPMNPLRIGNGNEEETLYMIEEDIENLEWALQNVKKQEQQRRRQEVQIQRQRDGEGPSTSTNSFLGHQPQVSHQVPMVSTTDMPSSNINSLPSSSSSTFQPRDTSSQAPKSLSFIHQGVGEARGTGAGDGRDGERGMDVSTTSVAGHAREKKIRNKFVNSFQASYVHSSNNSGSSSRRSGGGGSMTHRMNNNAAATTSVASNGAVCATSVAEKSSDSLSITTTATATGTTIAVSTDVVGARTMNDVRYRPYPKAKKSSPKKTPKPSSLRSEATQQSMNKDIAIQSQGQNQNQDQDQDQTLKRAILSEESGGGEAVKKEREASAEEGEEKNEAKEGGKKNEVGEDCSSKK
ncbi:hypothetical protein BX616_002104 [Lobosporangium transversale]|nr:hypothetical protein BX616_002104 [Lobosporangium transversale]